MGKHSTNGHLRPQHVPLLLSYYSHDISHLVHRTEYKWANTQPMVIYGLNMFHYCFHIIHTISATWFIALSINGQTLNQWSSTASTCSTTAFILFTRYQPLASSH